MVNIFDNLDTDKYEIYVYHLSKTVLEEIRNISNIRFINVSGKSSREISNIIYNDKIDILIEQLQLQEMLEMIYYVTNQLLVL